jgi:hypothetical protein
MRYGDRIYDRGIAGPGTGKAQSYFASDFDRLSDRLLDACQIAAVGVVACSTAALHALNQYRNAVLGPRRNRRGRVTYRSQNCFNQ